MKKKFTSLLVFVLLISMVLPAGTSFAAGKKAKAEHEKIKYDCWKHLFASRL